MIRQKGEKEICCKILGNVHENKNGTATIIFYRDIVTALIKKGRVIIFTIKLFTTRLGNLLKNLIGVLIESKLETSDEIILKERKKNGV